MPKLPPLKEIATQARSKKLLPIWILDVLLIGIVVIATKNLSPVLYLPTITVILLTATLLTIKSLKETSLKTKADQREYQLQSLLETLDDGIIIYNSNFKIIFINNATERILGTSKSEVLNQYMKPALVKNARLKAITQVMFPTLAPVVTQISEGSWPQITDVSLKEPRLNLRVTSNRVLDEKNNQMSFIKIINDRTREKNILESKGEFIDVAAHQLRTPLTAINWDFETIKDQSANNPEVKSLSEEGIGLAQRSLKIVNDLLNAARIEDGNFGYKFKELNLVELMNDVVNQAKTIAAQIGIKVNFFPPAAQEIKIQGDYEHLTIAASNIIDNAIRYNTENGKVDVSITQDQTTPFVKVTVEDTGIGIPEREIGEVFKKFHRGDNVTQVEPNGSGLGLFITKNIIKSHGGEIGIESVPERGSAFWFTLPTDPKLVPHRTAQDVG